MESSAISDLANLLRDSGDKVLSAESKLSLSAPLLHALNESFGLVVERGNSNSNFQVVNTNNSKVEIFRDLQFLHDFIQRTMGLCITTAVDDEHEYNVDISKFRNLKILEVHKIPICTVTGIQSLRAQLQGLMCIRCLQSIKDILSECGGDHSAGFVWSELKEAVFTYNNLETIDCTLEYLPWLQVLDLSHNKIISAEALKWLPNLKYVNLSYNQLEAVPMFNTDSSRRLQVLIINNNYVESLSGLQRLDALTELDLSHNCLLDHGSLLSLSTLASLRWLKLIGTPLSFHPQHRKLTSKYLHSNTATVKFLLDNVSLSKTECQLVGSHKPLHRLNRSPRKHLNSVSSTHSDETTGSNVSAADFKISDKVEVVKQAKKTSKAREVIISDHIDQSELVSPVMSESIASSRSIDAPGEHLETKKQIETLRQQFGDTWLHSQGGSLVQNVLGHPAHSNLQSGAFPSGQALNLNDALPCSVTTSSYLESNMKNALAQNYMDSLMNNKQISSSSQSSTPLLSSTPVNSMLDESSLIKPEDNETMYGSVQESLGTFISANESSAMGDTEGSEIFNSSNVTDFNSVSSEPENDEDTAVEEHLYLAQTEGINGSEDEVFVVITDTQIKERNAISGRYQIHWNIRTLLSCERTNSVSVVLTFDTIRRDRQIRKYTMDQDDAQKLEQYLRELLSSRPLTEMNQSVFRCMKCSTHFTQEIEKTAISLLPTAGLQDPRICPTCNSPLVVEMDDEPHEKHLSAKRVKTEYSKAPVSREKEIPPLVRSHSQSSIGSAGSLGKSCSSRLSGAESLASTADSVISIAGSLARNDSDIEVLSNPSQSSIEVLDRLSVGRKRSSEERRVIAVPSLDTIPDSVTPVNQMLKSPALGVILTESSSSGSLTDSICTAIENGKNSSSSKQEIDQYAKPHTDCVDIVHNDVETSHSGSPSIISSMLEGLFQSANNLLSKSKPTKLDADNKISSADAIEYSYVEFDQVDHRVKVHLYQNIFEDDNELLVWLLRATVISDVDRTPYPGCIVLSTTKFYILKIIATEGDDASRWLSRHLSYTVDRLECVSVLPWKQGVGVSVRQGGSSEINSSEFICLLQDIERTNSFLTYLANNSLPDNCELDYSIPAAVTSRLNSLCVCSTSSDGLPCPVQLFCTFTSVAITNESSRALSLGSLVVTTEEIIISEDNLSWLFEKFELQPTSTARQSISNLIEVDISETKVTLHYLDETAGCEETWKVTYETISAANALIAAISVPWENLFSVPLHVNKIDKE